MSPTIGSQITEFNEGFGATIGPELSEVFGQEQSDLRAAGVPEGVIGVGDTLPDAGLVTPDGTPAGLTSVLGGASAVLVFYRGAWCPYCNITLRTYQRELLPVLVERGVKLVAVSPQHPKASEATVADAELGFEVLTDPANGLASALGIVTEPSGAARAAHTRLGFEVSDSNDDGTARIPFPTVVVVDAGGTVRFVDVHTDYTTRTEVAEIVAAVARLR